MFNTYRLIGGSLFVLCLFITALAQENRSSVQTPREPVAPGPLVTATATAHRVRFVTPGTAVQLRLEVYNEAGQKLFDTELHGGNVLDWHLQDSAGQRLAAGAYACVLTSKSLSGRLNQRVGLVTVNDERAVIEVAEAARLSLAQQKIIGPGEGNAAFTVLQESEAEAITVVTHDGTDGQVTRTRGAFSFRFGDVFSGSETEQMRLTEEGNLGIGTADPKVKLDVAGMISAREGLMFADGSALNVNDKGVLTLTNASGKIVPNIAGTGTQNKIAVWTDNAGTLGDSSVSDVGGLVGLSTNSPLTNLHVNQPVGPGTSKGLLLSGDEFFQSGNGTSNAGVMLLLGVNRPFNRQLWIGDRNNLGSGTAGFFRLLSGVYNSIDAVTGDGLTRLPVNLGTDTTNVAVGFNNFTAGGPGAKLSVAGNLAVGRGFKLNAAPTDGLVVQGDVGIGTTNPAAKLDVSGTINTSRQYNIDGKRILSIAGTDNLFAGTDAGTSNTSGIFNAFFGILSGTSNTTGFSNSFFGVTSGTSNTTGGNNSFFGVRAGTANTTGGSNSFFGLNAGLHNTTASTNSFFGAFAGQDNAVGEKNAFFGFQAGQRNNFGGRNSFFGYNAGNLNEAGLRNSSFGTEAGMTNTGQDNVFVGDKAGMLNAQGILNTFIGAGAADGNATGSNNTALGANSFIPDGLSFATVIGAGAEVDQNGGNGDNTVTLGRSADEVQIPGSLHIFTGREQESDDLRFSTTGAGKFGGTVEVGMLGTVGAETLCRNVGTHKIALCSSSLRYKTNILPFSPGLSLVNRLQPIAFSWKESGKRDLGLGAEDVEKIEPLLVTYNDKGEVEGVKYDRVAVVLLNAVKEQQDLITKQAQQLKQYQSASLKQLHKLEQQQQQLDAVRRLVCRNNPRAKACK